ncbi:MAG: nitroreductase family protein [bacterium]
MNRRTVLIGGGAVAALAAGSAYASFKGMGSFSAYDQAARAMRAPVSVPPQTQDLIRYATLAPSGHNTQPWRFAIAEGSIVIHPDFSRRTPAVDPDDHHVFVSLGCAAETLALAAAAQGLAGEPVFDAAADGSIGFAYRAASGAPSVLFDAIPQRQSTRAEYDGRPVSAEDLTTLAATAVMPGVDLILITDAPQRDRLRDLVLSANTAQMSDPAFVRELKSWLRFSPRRALDMGDGLYGPTSGSPPLPEWLGPRFFDLFFKAKSENDKYARQLQSSAGIAVFVGAQVDPEHWVQVGRACQRFALQATALGLKCCFVNQPVDPRRCFMTKPQTVFETTRRDSQDLHKKILANIASAKGQTWTDVKTMQAEVLALAARMKTIAEDQSDAIKAGLRAAIGKLGRIVSHRVV